MTPTPQTSRAIIGLEIHVQLRTRTKLFCACPLVFDAPPNTCVCPVCLGHPGALPVINRKAFELALLTAMALNCRIARHTKWDRKSYYYPDLPKNYQISQYDLPLATEGYFDIPQEDEDHRVRIRRVHLEEDAGKNIHDTPGRTLVDLNRAGTPLLEIVTEPDLTSADQAYRFCVELQRLVTYLGVSEGNMKKGQMRFEPNVNVAIECDGREARTPIAEIKNLNSFRAVRDAIAYEIERQAATWRDDPRYILKTAENENRGWNAEKGVTDYQRTKETAQDYRYFPDPDLAPVEVDQTMLQRVAEKLPELPTTRRRRFVDQFNLSDQDVETIVAGRAAADLFERVIAAGASVAIATGQFINTWLKLANDRDADVADLGVTAEQMAELAAITADGTINKSAVSRLATVLADQNAPRHGSDPSVTPATGATPAVTATQVESPAMPSSPRELAETLGLIQVRDAGATREWVDQAFRENEQAVRDALSNPKKAKAAAGFLRGQVMRVSGGRADPKLVQSLIDTRLRELSS
ncbi:MAG: Asp-tRNA(Asn)/Glu-tRNA(Gln) amidotransferase subunit GatB [Phycisphaerae bacterium]